MKSERFATRRRRAGHAAARLEGVFKHLYGVHFTTEMLLKVRDEIEVELEIYDRTYLHEQ